MTDNLHGRMVEYYNPLVQDFLREVEPLNHPQIEHMPEPFFPAFGEGYERSALRMALIGQDTLG